MRKFMQSTLNFHPHDATPLPGPDGRWTIIQTKNGPACGLSELEQDCVPRQHAMPKGDTPIDNRYGHDMDIEGKRQISADFDAFMETR